MAATEHQIKDEASHIEAKTPFEEDLPVEEEGNEADIEAMLLALQQLTLTTCAINVAPQDTSRETALKGKIVDNMPISSTSTTHNLSVK